MSVLSKLKMSRPGQLLAMLIIAVVLGVCDFLAPKPAVFPGGAVEVVGWAVILHKAFVMWLGATEGLAVDMIVSHYARPGKYLAEGRITEFLHAMHRRAIFMALFALGMGLAL